MSEQVLVFGHGGGFTGAINSCFLMDNGQLFYHKSLDDSWEEMNKHKKKEAQKMFDRYTELGLTDMELNVPGNLYYFIEMRHGNSSPHRITWGDEDYKLSPSLLEYYQQLEKLLED
jgi:hypothetical protein